MRCGLCDGTGKSVGYVGFACTCCSGSGALPDDPARTEQCKLCDGSGKSAWHEGFVCTYCQGYGLVAPKDGKQTPADLPTVVFVEAGKPRTAQLALEEIFGNLRGDIRICDPYYGRKSLYRLDSLSHCRPIKFLTQRPDANETGTLQTALLVWKQEHGDAEFRRDAGRELHDRYVLSDDELILLGHGLKDVGSKDSFIVRIGCDLAQDLIDTVRAAFDAKWHAAAVIF